MVRDNNFFTGVNATELVPCLPGIAFDEDAGRPRRPQRPRTKGPHRWWVVGTAWGTLEDSLRRRRTLKIDHEKTSTAGVHKMRLLHLH